MRYLTKQINCRQKNECEVYFKNIYYSFEYYFHNQRLRPWHLGKLYSNTVNILKSSQGVNLKIKQPKTIRGPRLSLHIIDSLARSFCTYTQRDRQTHTHRSSYFIIRLKTFQSEQTDDDKVDKEAKKEVDSDDNIDNDNSAKDENAQSTAEDGDTSDRDQGNV